ncbi:hypothetical protein BCAR13_520105 [Paraburkholderia caribensis]|nr:hypothetical protein BCAR13_520105 [Paraburkholderia caribensis]
MRWTTARYAQACHLLFLLMRLMRSDLFMHTCETIEQRKRRRFSCFDTNTYLFNLR